MHAPEKKPMDAMDETMKMQEATGILADLYEQGSDEMRHLKTKGWVHLPGFLDDPSHFREGFNQEIRAFGFDARFGDPDFRPLAKDMPSQFWGIDTYLLPLGATAVDLRDAARDVMSAHLGVNAHTLASSFDGVMCAYSDCPGVGGDAFPKRVNAEDPKMPVCVTGGGGVHCDQSRFRTATAESHQIYIALTDARFEDLSTVLMAPCEGWSLQGVRHALELQFPAFYIDGGDAQVNISNEGYKLPRDQHDWLLAQKICRVIKPILKAGDALIWSSAIPHCGATGESRDKRPKRNPRLGIITAFCPKDLVPEKARKERRKCVGGGFCTGQQIVYATRHGGTFPVGLAKYKAPEKWPQAYHDLKRRRLEYESKPLYEDREGDDAATRAYRCQLRSLIG